MRLYLLARLLFVGLMGALPSSPASAFGVDVCYNAPDSGLALIANCIAVEEPCRTSNLIPPEEVSCRIEALADSMRSSSTMPGSGESSCRQGWNRRLSSTG